MRFAAPTRQEELVNRAQELAMTGNYACSDAIERRLREVEGCEDAGQVLGPVVRRALDEACRIARVSGCAQALGEDG